MREGSYRADEVKVTLAGVWVAEKRGREEFAHIGDDRSHPNEVEGAEGTVARRAVTLTIPHRSPNDEFLNSLLTAGEEFGVEIERTGEPLLLGVGKVEGPPHEVGKGVRSWRLLVDVQS
jgi:hypothetical protein